jgi:hypothetical protein
MAGIIGLCIFLYAITAFIVFVVRINDADKSLTAFTWGLFWLPLILKHSIKEFWRLWKN